MTNEQRVIEQCIRLAGDIITLAERSGVSMSPSAVRYELASALGGELSQSAIRRLRIRISHLVYPTPNERTPIR